MNWQYLIDHSIAIGVIVAWTAALALVIIYKWESMIKWFKWRIAYLIDWFYGDRVCWPRLVLWAEFDGEREDLNYSFTGTEQCREETAHFAGECWCGDIRGDAPMLTPEFWIRGRR